MPDFFHLKIVKGASDDLEFYLTKEEVMSQVNELVPGRGPSESLTVV